MTFKELGLKDDILSSLATMGFESPTPIQAQAIPYLLENQGDLVGLASTGTGKTASFGLPMIHHTDVQSKNVQGLVICPTRELCLQISRDLETYSKDTRGLKVTAVYGGTDIIKQIRTIERGVHIIVATPGRLVDLIKRKKVNISKIKSVVLDEADEMLNMGFKEDIDSILNVTPDEKSVWLFSATMPKEVARISKNYMTDPFEITVGGKNETNKNIEHHYYTVKERDRFSALKRIIDFNPEIYGLIFCRTRRDTAAVADKLMKEGYNAEPLHGDLSQAQRDRVMEKFRDKTLQILVATDVAARGIDVDDITHVIHYQLPEDVENYTHRSGRTARAGKKGVSIALINTREGNRIRSIERIIKSKFDVQEIPAPDAICEKQLMHLVEKITDVEINSDGIEKYLPAIMEKLGDFSKEEIITKFVSTEFNRFLDYYSKASNINAKADSRERGDRDGRERGGRNSRRGERHDSGDRNYNSVDQQRFFVNLGRKDGFNHGALLRLVCDNSGLSKNSVGKIDILNNFSFFEVDKASAPTILSSLKGVDFEGKEMNVEETNSASKKTSRSNYSGRNGGNSNRRRSGDSSRRSGNGSSRRRSY
ncbi:MAG: DEAD/DEAH box helicase [Crocinitomicaceae bacterium]